MSQKSYRVRIRATVDLIYDVEADSKTDAKGEAEAMAEACDLPTEFETVEIGKAQIEKIEE